MPRHIRPIRIEGNIAYVTLTKGYVAIIDAADVNLVKGWNWTAQPTPRTVYAVRKDCSGPKPKGMRMHRLIMGEPDGFEVDHEDGNGLNNRRYNLRKATKNQNQHNARARCDNKTGFKGVSWRKDIEKYVAYISLNGKRKHLGFFESPQGAHDAYVKASKDLHGEFGRVG